MAYLLHKTIDLCHQLNLLLHGMLANLDEIHTDLGLAMSLRHIKFDPGLLYIQLTNAI